MKSFREATLRTSRISQEYEWIVSLMGPPSQHPKPNAFAREIFENVRLGDGRYEEAIAAVMWHCGLSVEEAEQAIGASVKLEGPSIENQRN